MLKFLFFLATAVACSSAWSHGADHAPGPRAREAAVAPLPSHPGTRDPRQYFSDSELITQDGKKVRFYSDVLRDRVAVVNVMYTNCKDACPLITARLNEVRQQLGELFGSRVFFVSISSDPERDTPRALKKFARTHDADAKGWTFLTGSTENVHRVLGKLGQASQDAEDHSTLLLIMDVDAKRMRKVLPNVSAQLIAEHVKRIASAEKTRAPAGLGGAGPR